MPHSMHGTTIIGLHRNGKAAMGSDGQVTLGSTVMKHRARKVRRLFQDTIIAGFAGASADSFALLERFEEKLQQHSGHLERAAVELAKEWRTDRALRRLEAVLGVLDKDRALVISGTGDVITPDDGIIAIGSGGPYALAAARMLVRHTTLSAREIVEESLTAAGDICIYTNQIISIEEL